MGRSSFDMPAFYSVLLRLQSVIFLPSHHFHADVFFHAMSVFEKTSSHFPISYQFPGLTLHNFDTVPSPSQPEQCLLAICPSISSHIMITSSPFPALPPSYPSTIISSWSQITHHRLQWCVLSTCGRQLSTGRANVPSSLASILCSSLC